MTYAVWVEVEPKVWEQYTRKPFATKREAEAWAKRYLADRWEVRAHQGEGTP